MSASGSIVFLASHGRHARMWRRIRRVSPGFADTRVLAFERPLETPDRLGHYESLGTIHNRNYLRRLSKLLAALRLIRRAAAQASVVYCFSLDLLAMAWIASRFCRRRPRLAYEVADIRDALVGNRASARILRWVERALIRRSTVVVFTSQHYHDGYFQRVQRFTDFPHVVIEHKPEVDPEVRERVRPRDGSGPITVGYFGLMKSPASFRILSALAREGRGRVRVLFRGMFMPPLDAAFCAAEISASPHMSYEGPYRSPDDLPQIYSQIDLVWDAYNETPNSQWQRTTRCSEALFFKRPLLVNPATQDGRLVLRHGLGLAVDLSDERATISRILAIRPEEYSRWFANFERLPASLVFYTDEYPRLIGMLAGQNRALEPRVSARV